MAYYAAHYAFYKAHTAKTYYTDTVDGADICNECSKYAFEMDGIPSVSEDQMKFI